MSQAGKQFAAQWWRDLAPSLRYFIISEANLASESTVKAIKGDFLVLNAAEQERVMLVARDIMRDLKPITWMS